MTARARKTSSGGRHGSAKNMLYGLLALALTALLGWIYWKSSHGSSVPSRIVSPVAVQKTNLVSARVPPEPISIPKAVLAVTNTTITNVLRPLVVNPPQIVTQKPISVIPPVTILPLTNVTVRTDGLNLRAVQTVLEAQIALARMGICSGSIDGALGSQTRRAIRVFQQKQKLPVTGELDSATKSRLTLSLPVLSSFTVAKDDLNRLQPLSNTWLGKSRQSALDYENILELVSEKGHAHPAMIRKLNPAINWTNISAGATLEIPAVDYPPVVRKASFLKICLSEKSLQAFDGQSNVVTHFPCSIASKVEKRPLGTLQVLVMAPRPNYTFDPDIFPESAEGKTLGRKLVLPPGPNNPVGMAWIGLDRPGYGIHGTPKPEDVGRTESHGCFRLSNWNVLYLIRLVQVGTPVHVVP